MWNRYGAVVIAIIVFAGSMVSFALRSPVSSTAAPCPGATHEAILACGNKLPLSELTIADSQLLSSIPEAALKELIEHKFEVIAHGLSLPQKRAHEAFEMIDGIGKARAAELNKVLLLR